MMRKFYLSSLMLVPLTLGEPSSCDAYRVLTKDAISEAFVQQMKHEKYAYDLGIPEECVVEVHEEKINIHVINHKVRAKSLRNRIAMLRKKLEGSLNPDECYENDFNLTDDAPEVLPIKTTEKTASAKILPAEEPLFSVEEIEKLQEKFRALNNPEEDSVWNALFQQHKSTEGTSHTFVLESAKLLPMEVLECLNSEYGPAHLYATSLSKLLITHINDNKCADDLLKQHTLRNDTNLKIVFFMTVFNSFLKEKEYNKAMQIIKQTFRFSITEQQLFKMKHLVLLVSPEIPKDLESFTAIKKILDIQSLV
ncbi:MAG: hypothetical protein K2X53_05370 [Alphaproteobacteria bacterium]|nr:hypothetical protein [Alphaproteobacteria bacterium]